MTDTIAHGYRVIIIVGLKGGVKCFRLFLANIYIIIIH